LLAAAELPELFEDYINTLRKVAELQELVAKKNCSKGDVLEAANSGIRRFSGKTYGTYDNARRTQLLAQLLKEDVLNAPHQAQQTGENVGADAVQFCSEESHQLRPSSQDHLPFCDWGPARYHPLASAYRLIKPEQREGQRRCTMCCVLGTKADAKCVACGGDKLNPALAAQATPTAAGGKAGPRAGISSVGFSFGTGTTTATIVATPPAGGFSSGSAATPTSGTSAALRVGTFNAPATAADTATRYSFGVTVKAVNTSGKRKPPPAERSTTSPPTPTCSKAAFGAAKPAGASQPPVLTSAPVVISDAIGGPGTPIFGGSKPAKTAHPTATPSASIAKPPPGTPLKVPAESTFTPAAAVTSSTASTSLFGVQSAANASCPAGTGPRSSLFNNRSTKPSAPSAPAASSCAATAPSGLFAGLGTTASPAAGSVGTSAAHRFGHTSSFGISASLSAAPTSRSAVTSGIASGASALFGSTPTFGSGGTFGSTTFGASSSTAAGASTGFGSFGGGGGAPASGSGFGGFGFAGAAGGTGATGGGFGALAANAGSTGAFGGAGPAAGMAGAGGAGQSLFGGGTLGRGTAGSSTPESANKFREFRG
jgi:hypothetical protein